MMGFGSCLEWQRAFVSRRRSFCGNGRGAECGLFLWRSVRMLYACVAFVASGSLGTTRVLLRLRLLLSAA